MIWEAPGGATDGVGKVGWVRWNGVEWVVGAWVGGWAWAHGEGLGVGEGWVSSVAEAHWRKRSLPER